MEDAPRTSILTKAIAALVLFVAAWILLKAVIGFVAGIFWTVLMIGALLAVVWAYFTLRR
jgi:hypothetical protein